MDENQEQLAIPSNPFRWFPEFLEILRRRSRSQARLLPLAMLVGVVAGLGGVVFAVACQAVMRGSLDEVAGYRPHGPSGEAKVSWIKDSSETSGPDYPLLLLVTPIVGGLLSGWIVFRFAPEAEGHGTDAVIAAYHNHQGAIRARVPIIKIIASALTIGTGGSGGREGPIAQIGAGFGSLVGRLLKLRTAERRILLAAGMGAGISAIFRAPLAGALFAAEVLYRSPEFEPEVILPAGLASVVSYSTFGLIFGFSPLFTAPHDVGFINVGQLIPYTILAVAMPMLAMLYTRTFYWFTYLFKKLPIPRMLRPAVGAGLTGVIGVSLYYAFQQNPHVLSVMSFGYGVLQDGMRQDSDNPHQITALLLLAVALGKILTTSLTIGSGGSGGVFGPSMVVGGCGAGALGLILKDIFAHAPARFAGFMPNQVSIMIVGMAGFFAAAAKTPFSTLIIVCELTGDYQLIVPALWVCTISFLLSDEQSLYSSQVLGRNNSPAHQGAFLSAILSGATVNQVLAEGGKFATLKPSDRINDVIDSFDNNTLVVLPVVDGDNRLLGVVHLNELFWTSNRRAELPWLLAVDLMRDQVKPLTPELTLEEAVELFAENDLPELPVVNTHHERALLGMVRRTDIAKAYLRRVHAPRAPA